MCGIIYAKSLSNKPVNKLVLKQYYRQRNRGYEGFGYFLPQANCLYKQTKERPMLKKLKRKGATEILFHHRLPTSTNNVVNACHPFDTGTQYKYRYIMVHNGIVDNDIELFEHHQKLAITYKSMQTDKSFNDSEALLHDIAQFIEGKVHKITARGSIAFVMVQMEHDGTRRKLYFGRNTGSPLLLMQSDSLITLSSEGNGTSITPDTLYAYDYQTGTLNQAKVKFPSWYSYAGSSYLSPYSYGYTDDDDDWYDYSFANQPSDTITKLLNRYSDDLLVITNRTVHDDYKRKLLTELDTLSYGDEQYAYELCEHYIDTYTAMLHEYKKRMEHSTNDAVAYYNTVDIVKLLNAVLDELAYRNWYTNYPSTA